MSQILFYFFIHLLAPSRQQLPTDNPLLDARDSVVHQSVLAFFADQPRVGLSIGICYQGKEYYYNYGSTEKDRQHLPGRNSVYEIGSISKTFTGTLLASAVVEDRVLLDDDVRKFINKEYGSYPNLEYNHIPIRLKYLVSHVSGLPMFLPDRPGLFTNPDFDSLPFTISRIQNSYSRQQFFADLHKVTIDTVPGYRFRYSNAAAQLLQYVLENACQKTYEELLGQWITGPLAMSSTTAQLLRVNQFELVRGYNAKGRLMPYNPPMLASAGGIFSSTADMIRYLAFHLRESNRTVGLSHEVVVGDIRQHATGLNWQEQLTPNHTRKLWQSGGTFGFGSYCVLYPEERIAIVLLSNESDPGTQGELEKIATKIFTVCNDRLEKVACFELQGISLKS